MQSRWIIKFSISPKSKSLGKCTISSKVREFLDILHEQCKSNVVVGEFVSSTHWGCIRGLQSFDARKIRFSDHTGEVFLVVVSFSMDSTSP
jgi:hypothetical protein